MKTGIIGGSGLYDLEGLEDVARKQIATPFGQPSDAFVCGRLGGTEVFFLPRHGKGHRLLPSEINHRANIFAFKTLGADAILSVSAVGSLREDIHPRDIVLPDQYYDRTKNSAGHTFFGNGLVAHVSFGDPTCPSLRARVAQTAHALTGAQDVAGRVGIFESGTYVNMEGPAFSTKAESHTYRKLGFDVIGMTSLAEAKLCREAGICYQSMAMVTDYDCWHETEEDVSVEMVIEHLKANTALAKRIVAAFLCGLPEEMACACCGSLGEAILTSADSIPEQVKKDLAPIIGAHLG